MSRPLTHPPEAIRALRDKAGHLVRRAHQRMLAVFAEELRDFEVTGPQYIILVALALQPGVDQNGLAEMVDLDRWTVGDVLARLERRGLVLREVNAADRRSRLLFLSPTGRRMVREMEPAGTRVHARFLAPLEPEEQREFLRLLRKLLRIEAAH